MNDDTLIVTETEGDTFDLQLSESSTPETFRRRAASLTGSGLSESEARHVVATTPVPMELFCDSERGIFAVEAEPLAYSPLFNPYTGEEIPNENLRTEDAKLSDSRTATERDKILERYEAIDRIHRRRLVDLMTGIVSEMTGQSLDSGNEYPASDERQDKCYVTAFQIKHAVGCARRADRQLPYLQRPATREDSLRRSSARTDRLLRSAHTPYPLNPYNIMNDDTLIVTETEGDTFDLQLSESSTPETFRRRAASLTGSGLSESEARHVVATTPVPMELFCDSERGIFAVEAEPLAYSPLFNPYTGEEIPNENLRTEDAKLSDSRTATERDKILERYEAIDRIHRRRLVDLMTGIVSEMTGQSLDSGNEYPASDERQDKCYVTAFQIKHAVLYACLSYDYGGDRCVPVQDLEVGQLFDVLRMMLQDL